MKLLRAYDISESIMSVLPELINTIENARLNALDVFVTMTAKLNNCADIDNMAQTIELPSDAPDSLNVEINLFGDWRVEAIRLIRNSLISFSALVEEFDDRELAIELFKAAGKTIPPP